MLARAVAASVYTAALSLPMWMLVDVAARIASPAPGRIASLEDVSIPCYRVHRWLARQF